MSRQAATRLAWSVVGAGGVLVVVGVLVPALGGAGTGVDVASFVVAAAVFASSSVVGALVASRQPANAIGWILCACSAFVGVSVLAAGYASYHLAGGRHSSAASDAAAWFANWSYVWLFALAIFVLLLFPDGRLPSRRWRPVAWYGGLAVTLFAVGIAGEPGPLHDYPEVVNPLGISKPVADALQLAGIVLTTTAIVAAAMSMVVRFRRARGVARQQIKWLAVAGVLALAGVVLGGTIAGLGHESVGNVVIPLGILGIPIAIGVAMLRYRLYDIDRVISKTLVYGALTLMLAAAYVGLVLGGQVVFASFAGGGSLVIAGSTLVAVALFLPLRSRIQRLVDKRFYRRRYDAQRTLEVFGTRLREQVDLETLQAELRSVVDATMQPAAVSLWLRTTGTAP